MHLFNYLRIFGLLGLGVLLLAACDPVPDKPVTLGTPGGMVPAGVEGPRFKVVRVQIVHDGVAYYSKRGVYIITDQKTGIEYIGVSGVGISELGSHRSGKYTRSDER